MRRILGGAAVFTFLVASAPSFAQGPVCIQIDEAHDTLSPDDRNAAVLLLGKQFTLAGEQVVSTCDTPYVLAHIKLGNTISVSLAGPKGVREGTALGLDDLPALYSQLVRSLETGKSMTGLKVTDRTNVTEAQATAQRVHSDGFWYARVGYSGIFADQAYGAPAFGFGYRAELDRVAIDVSFGNLQVGDSGGSYYGSGHGSASAGTLIKLSGLYMLNPTSNSTPYFGAGLGWGHTSIYAGSNGYPYTTPVSNTPFTYTTYAEKSGLQAELSAGYEFARSTTIRAFVQADAALPLYSVESQTITVNRLNTVLSGSTHNYTPSVVVSLGLGWQKNRK